MTFAILIELPDSIKQELLRLCLGLSTAEWHNEENLYIVLHLFGKLTDVERWDILDRLGEINAVPFSLKIKGLNYSPKRNHTGILSAAIETSDELNKLKKNVRSHLRSFKQHSNENNHSNYETIRLGTVQNESPERMAQYFEANGEFTSSAFDVNYFIFAQLHQTNKRSFYTVEKRYLLV